MVLILIYSILFAFLSWRKPFWAIVFIVAFLPSYLIRFSVFSIPMTLLELMILILFFTWLIKDLRFKISDLRFQIQDLGIRNFIRNLKLEIRNYTLPILSFLLIATISIFVSSNLRASLGIWKAYFLEPVLFFLIFVNTVKTKKALDLIFYALGFSAFYISLFAIYQKFTGFAIPEAWQPETTRRVTSFFGYPNAVGLYLAPIVVLYLGSILQFFKSWRKDSQNYLHIFAYLFVCILSLAAVIFAHSHGALVGILAGLVFLLFFSWNKKKDSPEASASRFILIILSILALLIFSIPLTRNYILPIITFQDESGPIRLEMWKETLEMLKDRPLLGAGLAGYQSAVAPYHQAKHIEIYLYPHNIFLNFWSELGLAGLLIFLWIILKFFKLGFNKLQVTSYKLQVMSAMICILVHGLVDVPYFKNDLSVFFWLLVGMMVNIKAQEH